MSEAAGSESSVLARTAQGAAWMVAVRMVNRLLGLASVLILARLLTPEDFGLVALAFSIFGAIEACMAIGVETQLMRTKDPDRKLYDTAFTLNLLRAGLLGLLLAVCAAPLAAYMREARLETVILLLAAYAASGGLTNIGTVDFMRNLDFRRDFILQASPRLVQALTGIVLAFLLRDYWALLIAICVGRIATLILGYAMRPYRPRLTLVAWRSLVSVSFWSWMLGIAYMLRDRLDNLVIGRTLGPVQVGLYSVSSEIAQLPTSELVGPITNASMPGFAASLRADAKANTADAFLRIAALTVLIAMPTGLGVSLVAAPVVLLALGPAWQAAAPLIAVLSIAMIPVALGMIASALMVAHLRIRRVCMVTACAAALRIGILITVVPQFGLTGLVWGVAAALAAENLLLVSSGLRITGADPRRLLGGLWRPLIAGGAMALLLWSMGLGWAPPVAGFGPAIGSLATSVSTGFLTYVSVLVALWFAAGRPSGAETDLVMVSRRALGSAAPVLHRIGSAVGLAGRFSRPVPAPQPRSEP